MSTCTHHNAVWSEPGIVTADVSKLGQKDRIRRALGVTGNRIPEVTEETLLRYYDYLSAQLSFPFITHYPRPTNAREQSEFCCQVVDLLDPVSEFGDVFDGIFCTTWKGEYELKLPLIELELPPDDPNNQLIEDYWYWFWNWRR